MKHIKVSKAATGWTIRIEDREERVLGETEKSLLSFESPKTVFASVQRIYNQLNSHEHDVP